MKTTTVRKLLPEQWGFVCPVHTPDGGPCGLLNHISMSCCPLTEPQFNIDAHCDLVALATKLGMHPLIHDLDVIQPPHFYNVQLDGRLIGYSINSGTSTPSSPPPSSRSSARSKSRRSPPCTASRCPTKWKSPSCRARRT